MSDESEPVEEADADPDGDADAPDEEHVEEQEVAEDEEQEGLQDGDFIELAYTARTVEDDTLVDTTDEEVAEEEGVAEQGTFEPRTIVLGAGHIFEPVEEDIIGTEVGDTGSVVVEEAFGEYDEEEVRTVSADKIDEDDRYPGAQVQIDGDQGQLETIIGGRARVDFNHPLAGEDIEYEYELLDVIDDRLERARGLLSMFLDMELEMHIETDEVEEEQLAEPDEGEAEGEDEDEEPPEPEYETVTVEKETLYVEATPQLSMNQQWMFQKTQIAGEIMDRVGVDRVVVREVLDGQGMGPMGGMMGGMGGMGGGDVDEEDIEEAIEEMDIDADDIEGELEVDE